MLRSLVGSEMCIRDSYGDFTCPRCLVGYDRLRGVPVRVVFRHLALRAKPVSYTHLTLPTIYSV